jgi:hypothetical protein
MGRSVADQVRWDILERTAHIVGRAHRRGVSAPSCARDVGGLPCGTPARLHSRCMAGEHEAAGGVWR